MDAPAEKRPTILIVDDSPDSVALLSSLLRADYRVKVAISGERALAIVRDHEAPDLILLDIVLPDLDGYEVCKRLKANPATVAIPVIFLSAKADAGDEKRGLDLGAVDYITKPVSPSLVMAKVKTHLHPKHAGDLAGSDKGET